MSIGSTSTSAANHVKNATGFKVKPAGDETHVREPKKETLAPTDGLSRRGAPTSQGSSAPRKRNFGAQVHSEPTGASRFHAGVSQGMADGATLQVISEQAQATINANALALSTAAAQQAQALNEARKSMAEFEAKNAKSAGEALAKLA